MRSCVLLLSAVCGQPVEVMDRWLDLYYQVRHAQEKADAAARAAERLKEAEPFVIPGTLEAADTRATARAASQECRTLPARQNAPTEKDEGASQGTAVPSQEAAEAAEARANARVAFTEKNEAADAEDGGPMRASAPTVKDEAAAQPEPEPLRENRVKRPGGKGTPRPSQVGNTRGHDAAVFKRQVRDRLEAVRKKDVSAPEIVRAAPAGSVKESDIYMILQGHVIKIDIYRALDEALRHFEN